MLSVQRRFQCQKSDRAERETQERVDEYNEWCAGSNVQFTLGESKVDLEGGNEKGSDSKVESQSVQSVCDAAKHWIKNWTSSEPPLAASASMASQPS